MAAPRFAIGLINNERIKCPALPSTRLGFVPDAVGESNLGRIRACYKNEKSLLGRS